MLRPLMASAADDALALGPRRPRGQYAAGAMLFLARPGLLARHLLRFRADGDYVARL